MFGGNRLIKDKLHIKFLFTFEIDLILDFIMQKVNIKA